MVCRLQEGTIAVIKYISALKSRMLVVYWALECANFWDVAGESYWQCEYGVPVVDHQLYEC